MKLLMLTDVLFPDTIGGAGRVAYSLGFELSKKGHEVHFLTRNPDGNLHSGQMVNPNFLVHRFYISQKSPISLTWSEIINSYFSYKKLIKKLSFDVICIHQSLAATGPLLSGSLFNVPVIYYFHSPWHEEYLIKSSTKKPGSGKRIIASLMRRIEKLIVSRSNRVIVLSNYMSGRVKKLHGYPGERTIVLPGGVDLTSFRPHENKKQRIRRNRDIPDDKTIFLTVRNLVPRMGIENLIMAFDKSEILRNKGFLLICGDGRLRSHFKDMVTDCGLDNAIRFPGRIPDENLPGYYQSADYFVLPTERLEGFGLVILESLACGTPVIGTPVGAIPELIGLFDKKLIFEGTGRKDIGNKLEDIIKNPGRYFYKPGTCRDFVKQNFSWEKVAIGFENEVVRLLR